MKKDKLSFKGVYNAGIGRFGVDYSQYIPLGASLTASASTIFTADAPLATPTYLVLGKLTIANTTGSGVTVIINFGTKATFRYYVPANSTQEFTPSVSVLMDENVFI